MNEVQRTLVSGTLSANVRAALEIELDPAYPSNPILCELLDNESFTHNGEKYRAAHRMEPEVCELMGRLIRAHRLSRALEVGTLFGFSALYLAEALAVSAGHLTTIDIRPEEDMWDHRRPDGGKPIRNVHEVAERLIAESGYSDVVTFVAGHSNVELPRLVAGGSRFDVVVLDGAHDFPTVFLDFLSVDWMLDEGGYLFLDDASADIARRGRNDGGPNRLLESLYAAGRYEILPLSEHAVVCRKNPH